MKRIPRNAVLIACSALLVALRLPAQEPEEEEPQESGQIEKFDADMTDLEAHYPVFVRMADQLLPGQDAYREFCEQHAETKRSTLREQIPAELRRRADASFAAIGELVESFENKRQVLRLRRFWIVNGFACDATGAAVRAFAERDDVAFVYHQRVGRVQHLDQRRGPPALEKGRRDLARANALVESDEAPFDPTSEMVANLPMLDVPAAWRAGVTGEGVVVAVCSSGVLLAPTLVDALWRNPDEKLDGEDTDGNGWVDDVFGYDFIAGTPYSVSGEPASPGTQVAGVIAGRGQGSPPLVSGMAPRAKLMLLRDNGSLSACEYAITERADMMVVVWQRDERGLGHLAGLYRAAYEHLAACGVVTVTGAVAAKVRDPRRRSLTVPTDVPCVISTASARRAGRAQGATRAFAGWRGVQFYREARAPRKPDVAGLYGGFPVLMWDPRVPSGGQLDPVGLSFGPGSDDLPLGQSAGAVALMLAANPELTPWRVHEILEATCQKLPEQEKGVKLGAGLVQAGAAVKKAM